MSTQKFYQGATDTMVIRNQNIKRFLFSIFADSDNSYPIDLSKIRIKITLNRDNDQHTLYSGILSIAHMISTYLCGQFEFYLSAQYAIVNGSVEPPNYYLPIVVDLGGIINLDGDDNLQIEVNIQSGAYGGSSASNYMLLDVEPAIGIERYIPFINAESVPSSTSTRDWHLGDNVGRICVLSLIAAPTDNIPNTNPVQKYIGSAIDEKASFQYLQTSTISSDKYDRVAPLHELIDYRLTFFESQLPEYYRHYNYLIYEPTSGYALDGVKLNLDFDASKITSTGTVWVVWRSAKFTAKGILKAQKMEDAIRSMNEDKIYGYLS